MSEENTKPPFETPTGRMSLAADTVASTDNNPISDVEAQMRRALGLYGGMRARMDNDRGEQPVRMMDRFGPQGGGHGGGHGGSLGGNQGLHRRRFVQDGEIPVTVVRRDTAADTSAPQSSRLQRTEAALATETAARERAERALHDAQAQIAALQTKIGHAELARIEAADISRREKESVVQLRERADRLDERLTDMRERLDAAEESERDAQAKLQDERQARKAAERTARDLTERAEQAEAALYLLEQEVADRQDEPVAVSNTLRGETKRAVVPTVPARRGRPPGLKPALKPVPQAANEPEPVKWWLMPAGKTKVR